MDFPATGRWFRRGASARCRGSATRAEAAAAVAGAPQQFSIELKRAKRDEAELAKARRQPLRIAVRLALLAHLAADLVLVLGPWQYSDRALMFALAVPLAQASLVALWAGTREMPSYMRFVIAAAASAWAWRVAIAVLPGFAIRSAESAGWAAGLATQAAVVLAAVSAWSLWRQFLLAKHKDAEGNRARRRLQYSVGSLLAWTTVVAVLLGLGQTASAQLGWNGEVTKWTYFRFLPLVGVFNAAYALLVIRSLVRPRWIAARVFLAGVIITGLAWFQPRVLALLFGNTGGLERTPALILANTQAVLLYLTLLPVRICQWHADRRDLP